MGIKVHSPPNELYAFISAGRNEKNMCIFVKFLEIPYALQPHEVIKKSVSFSPLRRYNYIKNNSPLTRSQMAWLKPPEEKQYEAQSHLVGS